MKVHNYRSAAAKQERDHEKNVYRAVCPFCEKETTAREDAQGNLNIKATDSCNHFSNFSNSSFTFRNETIEEDPADELKNNEVMESARIAKVQASIYSFGGSD